MENIKNTNKNIRIDYETNSCGLENMYRGLYNSEDNKKIYCRFTGSIENPYWNCLDTNNNNNFNLDDNNNFNPDDNNSPYNGEAINLGTNIFGVNEYLLCDPNKSSPIKKKSLAEIKSLTKEIYPLPDCGIDTMYKGLYLDENNEYNIYCRYIKSESENDPSFLCTYGEYYGLFDYFPPLNNDNIPYDGRKFKKILVNDGYNQYGYSGNYRDITEETIDIYYNCSPNKSTIPPPILKPYCGSESKSKGWFKLDENSDEESFCRDIEMEESKNPFDNNTEYTHLMFCSPKNMLFKGEYSIVSKDNKINLFNKYKNRQYDGGYFDCPANSGNTKNHAYIYVLIILTLVIIGLIVFYVYKYRYKVKYLKKNK